MILLFIVKSLLFCLLSGQKVQDNVTGATKMTYENVMSQQLYDQLLKLSERTVTIRSVNLCVSVSRVTATSQRVVGGGWQLTPTVHQHSQMGGGLCPLLLPGYYNNNIYTT